MQKADITSALQKVLAVQSELLVYENIAGELENEYRDAQQQRFLVRSDGGTKRYSTRYPAVFSAALPVAAHL